LISRLPRARSKRGRRIGRRIERPPAHWGVLALVIAGLLMLLCAGGLSTALTGASGTPTAAEERGPLRAGDVLLSARDGRLEPRPYRPGRRIALSFDDGPDPTWTPRIAETLNRLGAPATFFVTGEHVVRHPDVARDLSRDGFELGNHTFNHADLGDLPDWQRDLQISLAESAISGAADLRPRLVRPPYSATPAAVTPDQARDYEELAEDGYLIVLSTLDSEDWRRPGTGEIIRNSTPPGRRGGIVLMHDGGGDRSQTVAALERLVPALKRRGFRFVPVSRIVGLSPEEAEVPATNGQRIRGDLLIGALTLSRRVTTAVELFLIVIAALAILRALVLVGIARRHAGAARIRPHDEGFTPAVSIVVPAYNEAQVIKPAVRSLAGSDYPDFEVIVVDDGSEDGTGALVQSLDLPPVRVIREANAGKPAALNTGVAAARHDLIVTVDADTLFEPHTLRRLVQPFRDGRVGAVAGNTKVGNRSSLLGRWQHIDYVMGFNLDRRLYDVLQCMPTVPGAIGAFRRGGLEEVGGFSPATLAEDTDVTIALGRAGWRVVYAEDARAFTETPSTLAGLWRQRYRWSYGTMQAVWKHKRALISRGEGPVGRRAIPYLVLFHIALPLLAPLIDVFAIYGLLFLDPLPVLAYWLGFNLLLLGLGIFAFRLDRESLRTLWAMPLQQLVYRQLMYLVVIQAVISALRGVRLRWQHVERTGEVEVAH
jgi:cellulose synthase/poly-beta-1,6-N-acetylglucosamine synthase-like glycosyltransferase/peptidoglycan/xylan/chitin deacetylase (PgdA/CDA1 family)